MSTGCGALDKTEKTGATSAFRSTQKKKKVLEGNIPKLYVSVWREKTL